MQENTVYHYTSLETLYHIINQACTQFITLRATHIDFLNDYTEHFIAINLMKEKLIACDDSKGLKSKGLSEKLNDKRISFFRNENFDEMYPHIISFSECWDSLAMWNTYANKSKGVALGFDRTKLSELEYSRFDKCEYDTSDYENFLDKNIETLHNCTSVNSYSIGFTQDFDSNILDMHFKYLPILKDKGYEYEKEYRLIIPNTIADIKQLKFHPGDRLLKPYKEISIPFEYLTEIVLAPGLSLGRMKTSLALFLSQKQQSLSLNSEKGKIHLRESKIPYRDI